MPVRALVLLVVLACAVVGGSSVRSDDATAAHLTSSKIVWNGKPWFTTGASLPYVRRGCDFGCGMYGGVRSSRRWLTANFQRLDRYGVNVVRWYVFPGDASQIVRDATGAPLRLKPTVYGDFDEAMRLAQRHDLYYVFVLFDDPRTLPQSWLDDAAQREKLATALGPLVSRYRNRRVLAWEIFNEPERGIDDGSVNLVSAQATVTRLAQMVHNRSYSKVTVGSTSIDRVPLWTGTGLDFYAPHWFTPMNAGPSCAGCFSYGDVNTLYNLDKPVVIGASDNPSTATAVSRHNHFYNNGYAGYWQWSIVPVPHPGNGNATSPVNFSAPWRLTYAHPDIGPRLGPRNPCWSPTAYRYRCPDFRMSRPSNLFIKRTSRGRSLLMSRNSLNNRGTGPAELFGRRNGRLTMDAVQRIRRASGAWLTVDTDARLYFKAIPGQYRYWKWRNAATFELWRLDRYGRPTELVRRGPKTVYCLRDLERTAAIRYSPSRRIYPACSQDLGRRTARLGTSVGWSDIYPATYHENWVDVTGLRGCFAYVHIADPTNRVMESNEFNNTSRISVRLPYRGPTSSCPGAGAITSGSGTAYSG